MPSNALLEAFTDDTPLDDESPSRRRTCIVPPQAQVVIALACAEAYDAGFWYGAPVPEAPAYARALAVAAHERGMFHASAAQLGDVEAP